MANSTITKYILSRVSGSASAALAAAAKAAAIVAQVAAEASAAAAAVSQAAAAAAASAAATSASAAATSATAAAASATSAGTHTTNAAASATAAATSATNAATSATAAATSATNAATSATNAASSATAATTNGAAQVALAEAQVALATTQANNAAASYNSFDDRYLGAKSSDPTLDNDGNALLTGALYWNTTAPEMRVYNGSAWVNMPFTAVGALLTANNLSDLPNVATARTNLGLGTLATQNGTFSGTSSGTNTGDQNLSGLQPLNAELTAIAGLTSAANKLPYFTGSGSAALADLATYGRTLIALADAAALATQLAGQAINNPTVTNYTEAVVAIGNSSTAKTIALTNGTVQTCTLTGNCTFTMPTATAGKSFLLLLKTGAGSFTATFTGVRWSGGTAPTITATANKLDVVSFVADGANWYGSILQNFTP